MISRNEYQLQKSEMSQYTISDISNSLNTTNSYNTNYYTVGYDLSLLLSSLLPNPSLQHSAIHECRVSKVGEWVVETEKLRGWYGFGGQGGNDKAVPFLLWKSSGWKNIYHSSQGG